MSRWFRWYEGTTEDGKFRVVARNADVTVATVMGVWAVLLEDASHPDHRGVAERGEPFYAAILDLDENVVITILSAMESVNLISVGLGAITVTKWKERQFETDANDPTNADRQRRFREKQKANASDTPRNGPVTATKRPDTDTDTDKKKDTPPSRGAGARYSDDFEKVWTAYRPIAAKNATKADAARAHANLNEADREACLIGVQRYASWLVAERQKRADTPAKHLATFIHKRGWEPFLDESAAAPAVNLTPHITEDDPLWPTLAGRYQNEHGRPPPLDKNRGWRFPSSYLPAH